MSTSKKYIDHLVYCAPNLEAAIDELEAKLGVKAGIGGKHTAEGTKNALINLGEKCYLEILAIDEDNLAVRGNRWMGIDIIKAPKLTRWSMTTTDMIRDSEIIKAYRPELAQIKKGSRLTLSGEELSWKMTAPLAEPEVELIPFLLDWSESKAHPTDRLEQKCKLEELCLHIPTDNLKVQQCINKLSAPVKIVEALSPRISVLISCPNGIVEL